MSCGVCLYSVIPSRLDVLRCHLISGHSFPPAFLVYLLVCVYLTRSSRLGNKLALNIQTDYSECTPLRSSGEEKEGPLASLVPLPWIISLPTFRLLSEPDPTTVSAKANVIFEQGLERDIDDMREKRLEQQDKSRRTIWQRVGIRLAPEGETQESARNGQVLTRYKNLICSSSFTEWQVKSTASSHNPNRLQGSPAPKWYCSPSCFIVSLFFFFLKCSRKSSKRCCLAISTCSYGKCRFQSSPNSIFSLSQNNLLSHFKFWGQKVTKKSKEISNFILKHSK